MKNVPHKVRKNNRHYILIKIYSNYALYEDTITKRKTCFTFHELGLIKDDLKIMRGFKKSPDKVRI